MKTIEQEAEELFPINSTGGKMEMLSRHQLNNSLRQEGFKSFVKSKSYQRQILQAQLKENESVLQMLKLHGNARNRLPIIGRITELQEKLNEL